MQQVRCVRYLYFWRKTKTLLFDMPSVWNTDVMWCDTSGGRGRWTDVNGVVRILRQLLFHIMNGRLCWVIIRVILPTTDDDEEDDILMLMWMMKKKNSVVVISLSFCCFIISITIMINHQYYPHNTTHSPEESRIVMIILMVDHDDSVLFLLF